MRLRSFVGPPPLPPSLPLEAKAAAVTEDEKVWKGLLLPRIQFRRRRAIHFKGRRKEEVSEVPNQPTNPPHPGFRAASPASPSRRSYAPTSKYREDEERIVSESGLQPNLLLLLLLVLHLRPSPEKYLPLGRHSFFPPTYVKETAPVSRSVWGLLRSFHDFFCCCVDGEMVAALPPSILLFAAS